MVTDEPGTGQVDVGEDVVAGAVPAADLADLADVVVAALRDPDSVHGGVEPDVAPRSVELMNRIAVVGGHGQVARHLLVDLRHSGHEPVALVRKPDYREDLESRGAEVRLLDIENSTAEDFASSFAGCDAVVFAAGGGPDGNLERKRTVDLEGSLKSIEGARQAGIRRFVQVSAIDVDEPVADDAGEVWKAYVEAKRDSDAALRASDLDWTIIRPGRLTDEPAVGTVALAPRLQRGEVTRADVAAVVAAVLDAPHTIGQQLDLVGGDTPVADAVAGLG